MKKVIIAILLTIISIPSMAGCYYDKKTCLNNTYRADSNYKYNEVNNTFSQYGRAYTNKPWRNPYVTNETKIYDQNGNYRGRLNTNNYAPSSMSNNYIRYKTQYQ